MLSVHNISKSFNIKQILKDVSFNINPADRIGLIGPNGSGKTTLLKIILGHLEPDRGTITCKPIDLQLGYLAQALDLKKDTTIGELVSEEGISAEKHEQNLESLASAIAEQPDNVELQADFDETLKKLEDRLKHLEKKIKEAKKQLPAHSIKPPVMTTLLDLEDERDAIASQISIIKKN